MQFCAVHAYLRTIRVLSSIGHGEQTRLGVLQSKVLICERDIYLSNDRGDRDNRILPANFSP
jgi:hypothetical protein